MLLCFALRKFGWTATSASLISPLARQYNNGGGRHLRVHGGLELFVCVRKHAHARGSGGMLPRKILCSESASQATFGPKGHYSYRYLCVFVRRVKGPNFWLSSLRTQRWCDTVMFSCCQSPQLTPLNLLYITSPPHRGAAGLRYGSMRRTMVLLVPPVLKPYTEVTKPLSPFQQCLPCSGLLFFCK